jgi:hypothetical protein
MRVARPPRFPWNKGYALRQWEFASTEFERLRQSLWPNKIPSDIPVGGVFASTPTSQTLLVDHRLNRLLRRLDAVAERREDRRTLRRPAPRRIDAPEGHRMLLGDGAPPPGPAAIWCLPLRVAVRPFCRHADRARPFTHATLAKRGAVL